MQMNMFYVSFTVMALWWQCSLVSSCIDPDLASCTTAFTDSLQGSVLTHKAQFCTTLQRYRSCIADICTEIPKDMIDYIVKAQSLYNFDCGITAASVRDKPSAPLLLLMAVILPALVLH